MTFQGVFSCKWAPVWRSWGHSPLNVVWVLPFLLLAVVWLSWKKCFSLIIFSWLNYIYIFCGDLCITVQKTLWDFSDHAQKPQFSLLLFCLLENIGSSTMVFNPVKSECFKFLEWSNCFWKHLYSLQCLAYSSHWKQFFKTPCICLLELS